MNDVEIDRAYDQLTQQGRQTADAIQALAQKLQAAASAGTHRRTGVALDLREIALAIRDEEGQMSTLLQSIHAMVDNHVQDLPQQQVQQAPQYASPQQYAQPQYAQPQYAQPVQYAQPSSRACSDASSAAPSAGRSRWARVSASATTSSTTSSADVRPTRRAVMARSASGFARSAGSTARSAVSTALQPRADEACGLVDVRERPVVPGDLLRTLRHRDLSVKHLADDVAGARDVRSEGDHDHRPPPALLCDLSEVLGLAPRGRRVGREALDPDGRQVRGAQTGVVENVLGLLITTVDA